VIIVLLWRKEVMENNSTSEETDEEIVIRAEEPEETELRQKLEKLEQNKLENLEAGSKTLIQLVTGLYGLLFAVLAFGENLPVYLQSQVVQCVGTVSLMALLLSLVASLVAVFPWPYTYRDGYLSDMERVFKRMEKVKSVSLSAALICFLIGIIALAILVLSVVWGW
jgi:hypothetical protein